MRSVNIQELQSQYAFIWNAISAELKAKEETETDVVITSDGKPIALLSVVTLPESEKSSEELAESLVAASRRIRAQTVVAAMQQSAKEAGLDKMSLGDINAVIDDARTERA